MPLDPRCTVKPTNRKKLYVAHIGYTIPDHILYIGAYSRKQAWVLAPKYSSNMNVFSIEEKGPLVEP
jgi:hypothetical protein